jgi:hypothetical protein
VPNLQVFKQGCSEKERGFSFKAQRFKLDLSMMFYYIFELDDQAKDLRAIWFTPFGN